MAKFNPDTNLLTPPDTSRLSKGFQADTSTATAISGLGNAALGAVNEADRQIQSNIRDDVRAIQERANNLFGVDDAETVVTDDLGLGRNPPELGEARDYLRSLSNAHAAGKLKDYHYTGLIDSRIKKLRSVYPGFAKEIDKITMEETGIRPANVVQKQLAAEFRRTRASMDSQVNDNVKWFNNNRDKIYRAVPNAAEDPNAYPIEYYRAEVGMMEAREQAQTVAHTQFERNVALGRYNDAQLSEQADDLLATGEGNLIDEFTQRVANTLGVTVDGIGDGLLNSILADGEITPEEQLGMDAARNKALADYDVAHNKLVNTRYGADQKPLRAFISGDAFSSRDKGREQIIELFDMFSSGDTTLATRTLQMQKYKAEHLASKLASEVPGYLALKELNLDNEAISLWNDRWGTPDSVALFAAVDAATRSGNLNDKMETLVGDNLSKSEKQEIGRGLIQSWNELLTTPSTPDKAKSKMVTATYGDRSRSPLDMLAPDSRLDVYTTMAAPAITDAVVKLNDDQASNAYLGWVETQFTTIPQWKRAVDNITFAESRTDNFDVDFNSETMQLEVKVEGELNSGRNFSSITNTIDSQASQRIRTAQKSVGELNRALGILTYTYEKMGVENPAERLLFMVEGIGADLNPDRENTLLESVVGAVQEFTTVPGESAPLAAP